MTTLRELHHLRGNPDFSHWNTVKLFSIAEASLLTAGLEPCEYNHLHDYQLREKLISEKPINWQHSLMLIRSIIEAICTQEIKSPYIKIDRSDYNNQWDEVVEQARVSIEDVGSIIASETKIHRDELYKWLKKNGYLEPHLQNTIIVESQPVTYKQHESVQQNNVGLLPEPTYTTPLLEIVDAVIDRFWSGYKPDENMVFEKQLEIERWIKETYPDIANPYIAKAIDRICRHPTAKLGGNKKIK
ncbi:hypothetical protein D9K80_08955 [Acinetobacter cumulans]|uniref:Uncharacterized protein n=1 Tax=Acinetobacter cumulans TaxID=2136182 RepID=A0A498CWA0_9GAMM|nr:hypothetical protein [Acinetobacter cumulans]RLL35265.1 hypothetical protein D9K80_08955 [Acinetobacter cumulans]